MDVASLKLAEFAAILEESAEQICYNSIINLTIHVFKDPRAKYITKNAFYV
jgi:hypothetical protein